MWEGIFYIGGGGGGGGGAGGSYVFLGSRYRITLL